MHGGRNAYYVRDEGVVVEPPAATGAGPEVAALVESSLLEFGRLLGRRPMPPERQAEEAMAGKLTLLGDLMNNSAPQSADASDIPAGYTYLGQFITHEVTFDDTNDTLKSGMVPHNLRTPQIDLDSLYGAPNGPQHEDYKKLYEDDGVHFKIGETALVLPPKKTFPRDLPRDAENPEHIPTKARIADERNDENLAVAQTHVAFLKFHNKVADSLKADGHPDANLFDCARREVIRHFQWIIVHDYLPKLVNEDVLKGILDGEFRLFLLNNPDGTPATPVMPLEFSAAAFRIGHTMVRATYNWNKYHRADGLFIGPASVTELFNLTGFRNVRGPFDPLRDGFTTGMSRPTQTTPLLTLPSDWIIDWRRFYDFSGMEGVAAPPGGVNMGSKLDTHLNFHLDRVQGFPGARMQRMHVAGVADDVLARMQKAISVRNLLRGFYLGLPTGEEAAQGCGEQALTPEEVIAGPHEELLRDPDFRGQTPLWYYILKEAELKGVGPNGQPGNRLGPVGSRIVAETLVGLIRKSDCSILKETDWRPKYGRPAQGGEPEKFEMTDLLMFAFDGDVNPLG
jgi:hypothetical protein